MPDSPEKPGGIRFSVFSIAILRNAYDTDVRSLLAIVRQELGAEADPLGSLSPQQEHTRQAKSERSRQVCRSTVWPWKILRRSVFV